MGFFQPICINMPTWGDGDGDEQNVKSPASPDGDHIWSAKIPTGIKNLPVTSPNGGIPRRGSGIGAPLPSLVEPMRCVRMNHQLIMGTSTSTRSPGENSAVFSVVCSAPVVCFCVHEMSYPSSSFWFLGSYFGHMYENTTVCLVATNLKQTIDKLFGTLY
jgi:hypothetical protein